MGYSPWGHKECRHEGRDLFLQHQKRGLWTFSLLRGRVLSTVLRLDVRDVLEHLKLTVLPNHLGILRKCRFWLSMSGVGRDTAFFFFFFWP